jgi:putative lipoic acid-binding regulatory protein
MIPDPLPEESGFQFPLEIRLRVIGHDADDLTEFVYQRVLQYVPDLTLAQLDTRPSGGGKYLAVRVAFTADSREQLDNIFRDLSAHERILYII